MGQFGLLTLLVCPRYSFRTSPEDLHTGGGRSDKKESAPSVVSCQEYHHAICNPAGGQSATLAVGVLPVNQAEGAV